jgi:hypothetical protein
MNIASLGCAGLIALTAITVGVGIHTEYGTQHNVTFTVQGLDDQSSGSNGHKYLIFATNGDVYENTDALLHGKTDSSEVWSKFMQAGTGAEWNCPEYGYRNTFFSSYPDILDGCVLIKQGKPISVS